METFHRRMINNITIKVLTVPMRNGNIDKGYDLGLLNLGSYRTYEEWKQGSDMNINEKIKVLTVPMRNGNFLLDILHHI